MNLDALLEAVLFAMASPLSLRSLASICHAEESAVEEALSVLAKRLDEGGSGLQLLHHGKEVELVTRGDAAETVREALKQDAQAELSRPSLEALAVLAYRGPLTRPELEQIRGVQSALILRNLLLRGLVEMKEDTRLGQPMYAVTGDFLKHIGVDRLESLPDFEALHHHTTVERVLEELKPASESPAEGTLSV